MRIKAKPEKSVLQIWKKFAAIFVTFSCLLFSATFSSAAIDLPKLKSRYNGIIAKTLVTANMRTQPAQDGPLLKVIPPSNTVEVHGLTANDYYYCRLGAYYGYIARGAVAMIEYKYDVLSDTKYISGTKTIRVKEGATLGFYHDAYGNVYRKNNLQRVNLNGADVVSQTAIRKSQVYEGIEDGRYQKTLLGSVKTYYSMSDFYAGKRYNIALACEKTATMLLPNEEFNWHDIVGNVTKADGFQAAIVYSGGKEVMGYGGGVCQWTSTCHLLILNLNKGRESPLFKIIERNPHGLPVNYVNYAAGEDASVDNIGGINFIFRNDTGKAVIIESGVGLEYEGAGEGFVEVRFYTIEAK